MDLSEIRQQLEHELRVTGSRLRQQGWPVDPKQLSEVIPAEEPAGDPLDQIEATENREQHLVSRERLTERVNQIVEALHRLRDGSYGTCAECGEPIASGRLRAIPEATLCVRCQERAEPVQAGRRTTRAFYAASPGSLDEPEED